MHHSVEYPQGLLRGLVVCAVCGRRMWQEGRGGKHFLACPDSGEGEGLCSMRARVPVRAAEEALVKMLAELFERWPEWISRAIAAMRAALEEHFKSVPQQLAADQRQLAELKQAIDVILTRLENPKMSDSEALDQRLAEREAEFAELKRTIQQAEEAVASLVEFPDEAWIREQLRDIPQLFREDVPRAARLLRRLIGRIEASAVVAPGKKRGFAQLKFRIGAWDLALAALGGHIPESVSSRMREATTDCGSPEFVIELGQPGRMETWAPKIAEMRANGVKWQEICEITKFKLGPAYEAWRRYVTAMKSVEDREGGDEKAAS